MAQPNAAANGEGVADGPSTSAPAAPVKRYFLAKGTVTVSQAVLKLCFVKYGITCQETMSNAPVPRHQTPEYNL